MTKSPGILGSDPLAPELELLTREAADSLLPPLLLAIQSLSTEEKNFLRMRFYDDQSVREIGLALGLEARQAYNLGNLVIRKLRSTLETSGAAGVDFSQVLKLVDWDDVRLNAVDD